MQSASQEVSTCPTCGGALEETSAGELGCMPCLLQIGIRAKNDQPHDVTSKAFEGDARFGVYVIGRHPDGSLYELGHGAMGVTYRAIDTSLDREVALKIIKTDSGYRSAEARARFMREARAAAALRHENIATVFQFGIREETGQCFYAMELIEGETLEERVRRSGPLDICTTIGIAQQVTAALIAAEKRGVIHRDLKPANLMLVSSEGETADVDRNASSKATQRHRHNIAETVAAPLCRAADYKREKLVVKIIDFGLAKALNDQIDSMSLTANGFVGTPAFASPEQFESSSLDVRSDIYSLGATLWFALTGKRPFSGHGGEEIHRAQKSGALPVEELKAARVPSRLRSLLHSMLAVEPAARPSTRDLAARLRRCAVQASGVQRTSIALVAGIIVILGACTFFVFHSLRTHPAAAGSASNLAVPEKSIAVLPFENLSDDKEHSFFADGVQDDVLTKLAKIADLKVISRTSVMQYRGKQDLRQIGRELGVSHVLAGTVRRSDGEVHINAQLLDTRTDAHVWAEEYHRDLNEVFAIEAEVAQAIATQLQATLSPRERSAIEHPTTSDITAFDLYTRAHNLILARSFGGNAKAIFLQAVDLLNQAVVRDRSFFQAYCQLAQAHDSLYLFGFDHTSDRLRLAEAAVQAADRLHPDAGETHFARAENLYEGHLDYDGALFELELAARSLPNDPRVFALKGYIDRRQGRWEESIHNLERAIDLDPRNVPILQQTAMTYEALRRYAEEISLLDRALAIEPNDVETKVARAFVQFLWKADIRLLHQTIDSIRAASPGAVPNIADNWLSCALAERDIAAATNALKAFGETPSSDHSVIFNRPLMEGLLARMSGDDEKARAAFTLAREEQEKAVQAQPNYGPPLCVLGLIDAGLGRKDKALREGQRALELVPVEKDALNGPFMIKYLAMIAAWVGEKDLACDQLETVIRRPSFLAYGELKLLPWWDPLRDYPRFEQIVASLAPK